MSNTGEQFVEGCDNCVLCIDVMSNTGGWLLDCSDN